MNKREMVVVDLNKDFNASATRIEELRAKRPESEIPLTDEYWKALKKHRQAFSEGKYGK